MVRKIRFAALAGLLLALAGGFVLAQGDAEDHPGKAKGAGDGSCSPGRAHGVPILSCPAEMDKADHEKCTQVMEEECDSDKDSCCCQPGKPKPDCPCRKQAVHGHGIWSAPAPTPYPSLPPMCRMDCSQQAVDSPQTCAVTSPVTLAVPPCCPLSLFRYPAPGMPMQVRPPAAYPGCQEVVNLPYPAPCTPYGCMPAMMPAPCMPPLFPTDPLPDGKEYVVEMRMVEKVKDGNDRAVAMPRLCVIEGEQAHLSCGSSHTELWSAGVPANDFGHEGYQVDVTVLTDMRKKDHVCVRCSLSMSEPDPVEGIKVFRECQCSTTRSIELGKTMKLPCNRSRHARTPAMPVADCETTTVPMLKDFEIKDRPAAAGEETIECWLEITVREAPEDCTASGTPCNAEEECILSACKEVDACTCPVERASCTDPARTAVECKETKKDTMVFTVVEAPSHCATGKLGDLNPTDHMLHVCRGEKSVTCEKFTAKLCCMEGKVKLCIEDGHVQVCNDSFCAHADKVTMEESGCTIVLEGHVHIDRCQYSVDVKQDCVHITMPCQTGVISSPALIQEP